VTCHFPKQQIQLRRSVWRHIGIRGMLKRFGAGRDVRLPREIVDLGALIAVNGADWIGDIG